MRCQSFTSGYICTNATGTTCTKKYVQVTLFAKAAPCDFSNGDVAVLEQVDLDAIAALQATGTTTAASLTSSNSAVTALQGQMTLIQSGTMLQAAPAVRADVLQAEGVIFGLTLAAAAVIWGAKHLLHLFKGQPNED